VLWCGRSMYRALLQFFLTRVSSHSPQLHDLSSSTRWFNNPFTSPFHSILIPVPTSSQIIWCFTTVGAHPSLRSLHCSEFLSLVLLAGCYLRGSRAEVRFQSFFHVLKLFVWLCVYLLSNILMITSTLDVIEEMAIYVCMVLPSSRSTNDGHSHARCIISPSFQEFLPLIGADLPLRTIFWKSGLQCSISVFSRTRYQIYHTFILSRDSFINWSFSLFLEEYPAIV
jgi:hypothetical protein